MSAAWANVALAAGGVVGAVAVVMASITVPQLRRLWGRQLYAGPRSGNRIALTFDDGPTPGATDLILDVLARERVVAAFFVVGANAERHPELVARVHAEGHLVGNHSFRHSHYGFMRGPWYWRREIAGADAAVARVTGARPTTFRPPMGMMSPIIAAAARRAGHRVMIWTHRGMDGVRRTTPERILERLDDLRPGDVIVLHDGVEPNGRRDPMPTVRALPELIRRARAAGLEFARLDDLHGLRETARDA